MMMLPLPAQSVTLTEKVSGRIPHPDAAEQTPRALPATAVASAPVFSSVMPAMPAR